MRKLLVLCGLTLVLSTTSALFGGNITVLPIKVCDNLGANCANNGGELYQTFTDKIWAQANLTVTFLPFATISSTTYQNFTSFVDEATFFNDTANNGISGTATVITMWFVKSLTNGDWGTVDSIGGRKVMIADNVFTANRYDTIAHELGHNLGLTHADVGATTADYLMASGGTRTIPTALGDVNPDGTKLDKLTAAQITTVNSSTYVVPEPGTMVLLAGGIGVMVAIRRRRQA